MSLFDFLDAISKEAKPNEKEKQLDHKLLEEEAKVYGLTHEEIEECKKSGITPAEWVDDEKE